MAKVDSAYNPIFDLGSSDNKPASTSRNEHIRRLSDILHLSLERGDLHRARRAWAILARCKEFDWSSKWRTGLLLLTDPTSSSESQKTNERSVEFLKKLMRFYPDEQESILQEIILNLAGVGKFREALDELDLYLPSFPYQENSTLHSYAGLMTLKLANSSLLNDGAKVDSNLLRKAQKHLKRAASIDPDNIVANVFVEEAINQLAEANVPTSQFPENVLSDEEMNLDDDNRFMRGKRLRRTASRE